MNEISVVWPLSLSAALMLLTGCVYALAPMTRLPATITRSVHPIHQAHYRKVFFYPALCSSGNVRHQAAGAYNAENADTSLVRTLSCSRGKYE